MRILIPQNFYTPNSFGGAERSVQLLAEGLAERGHEVHVACLALETPPGRNEINGVRVHYLPINHLGDAPGKTHRRLLGRGLWQLSAELSPKVRHYLEPLLKQVAPDVVHTHNLAGFSVSIWNLTRRFGVGLVHTLMGLYLLCPKGTMLRAGKNCTVQCLGCRVFAGRRKTLSSLVDVVVGNSQFVLDLHRNAGYFANAVPEVVYSGARLDFGSSRPARQSSGGELHIGYLGRLHASKGPQVLLDVIDKLPSAGWRLLVGGSGVAAYEQMLRQRYAGERVHFEGWVASEEFLSKVDVLVVPSLCHDVLPRVIFEAHARGIPVVGSQRGGIPEMVEDRVTGWLFEPEQPGRLAQLLCSLIANPGLVGSLRGNCLAAVSRFDNRVITRRYLDIYQRVVSA